MSSHNHVTLLGRVGKDPEVRYLPDGKAICNISLATNRGKRQDGTELPPDWHYCAFYGRTAEVAGEYLKKGSLCLVEGRIHYEKWTDQQTGQEKQMTKIHCHVLRLISTPKIEASGEANPPASEPQPEIPDDERPF